MLTRTPRPLSDRARGLGWPSCECGNTIFTVSPLNSSSTYLFFELLGPTSPTHVCFPDMSLLSTCVWVQHAACKVCKGKRGPLEPSFSHPKKPSSLRQKRVFIC